MSSSTLESAAIQDALLIAFQYLSAEDIDSVSQTCQTLRQTCTAKQLWLHVWHRDVLQERLPVPACLRSLDLLSDSQMKAVTIHALRLRYNLTCCPERRVIQRVAFHQAKPITWTRLIGASWLLVAMSDTESSVLSLYSVDSLVGARHRDLLAQAFLEGPVLNGLTEVSSEHGIIIALELRTSLLMTSLEILSIRNYEGSLKFVRLARHTGVSHTRVLRGSFIGCGLHDDHSVPSILNWRTGSVTHLSSRPDIEGGVVAMILDDDYIAYLTPRKLRVLRLLSSDENGIQHSIIATFALQRPLVSATMAFSRDDQQVTVQVFTSNGAGVYMYSASIPHHTSMPLNSRMSLLWSREATRNTEPFVKTRMQPLLDRTSTTVSWLERISHTKLSTSLPAIVRFATITEDLSRLRSPLQNPPYFELSERSMPALYASSSRDYDQGLGLLVIGNMIGELALYNFGGDALIKMQGALQTVEIRAWGGEELLPHTPISSCQPAFPWVEVPEADKQTYLQLWQKYYPPELGVPEGWCRCSPFTCLDGYNFLDHIGNPAWELDNLCHFLGRAVPLIRTEGEDITLFTAGGLYFFYFEDAEEADAHFSVLNPDLGLNDIIAQLPVDLRSNGLQVGMVVNFVEPDPTEPRSVWLYAVWEQRHGINRWGDFLARGGRAWADYAVTYIRAGPRPPESLNGQLGCTGSANCPLCTCFYAPYYARHYSVHPTH